MGVPRDPSKPYSRAHRGTIRQGTLKVLPLECEHPAPSPPPGVTFTKEMRATWRHLWKGPHGNFWDEAYASEVAAYVLLTHQLYEGQASAWVAAERGKLSTQLGLTPVALRSLGYTLNGAE